ncbi:helix-turn-helix domain-containing protein [Poseidonibacter lekithochrous]|uniref:helix-turn-helix domain-containing protein n=1 Tax=Poseidonibacter lekithochrous TaxID=1904463 RepID=UPI0013DCBDAC|nr:helix-turn-helix transcriptional regulator [Poseidonibacter lekithochrous]
MNFGERLVEAREKLGFNQSELAEKLEIAPQSLARYEKNKVKPSMEFVAKLTDMFNMNSNWLLTGKGTILVSNENNIDYKNEIIKILNNSNEKELECYYHFLKALKLKR